MPRTKCDNCGTAQVKPKRAPNSYNKFVQETIGQEDIRSLPSKERMKAVAAKWKSRPEAKSEAKSVS